MTRLIIVDMDGVLFDTSKRYRLCEEESGGNRRAFWECYQSPKYMDLDEPKGEVIDCVKGLAGTGVLIVLSGRSVRQREKTEEQLRSIGLEPREVVLRGEKDFRKDYEFKLAHIQNLLRKYRAEELVIVEDSERVIERVESELNGLVKVRVECVNGIQNR